ncbi:MAG: Gfo/Idh/MocA family oxidoreductase [Spirochaetaceae bacterium]|nr:Gfo/Idh/MocA family oxidoreductase [Spirochaetaceae bacterium]
MGKTKIGIIGCGMISEIYLKNLTERFRNIEVGGCADAAQAKAHERAVQFGILEYSVDELLARSDISIILNLTVPRAHVEIGLRALEAGKHVYSEKPLAIDVAPAHELLQQAQKRGLRVGCAPDTFLGGGIQTARKLLDDGWIGEPIGATGFYLSRGPEAFHPNPAFLYQPGAGPLFDMGPYYLTALVSLLGPAKKVGGFARKTYEKTMLTRPDKYGETFDVEVPTYINGTIEFSSGVIANLTTSFDMQFPYWESKLPYLQIFGTEGTMTIPDPNKFEGPVQIRRSNGEVVAVPLTHGFTENCRGIGLSDMAHCIEMGEKHRANGEMAFHVLEIMSGILDASSRSEVVPMTSSCERPQPLPRVMPNYLYD